MKSDDSIADARELEGENGGVIVDTLDSGEILQSVAAWEAVKYIKQFSSEKKVFKDN